MRWFWMLCGAVAGERLVELAVSRRHERQQAERGGHVVREPAYAAMVAVHAGTLIAAPIEASLRRRRAGKRRTGGGLGPMRAVALGALFGAQALRAWTLTSLGDSWSTRVTRYDWRSEGEGRRVVDEGPYHYIRHPNYLAVIVELAALPLAGGAWLTALVASAANALVLARRIPLEERELMRDPSWVARLGDKPRFLPRLPERYRPSVGRPLDE